MKNFFKYLLLLLIIIGIGGYIFWQKNKKQIVKNIVNTALKKSTDNLYFIQYDSAAINEVDGDAIFYNVKLRTDSTQFKILQNKGGLPNILFAIKVNKILLKGVDVKGLIQKEAISANKILLYHPVVDIIQTGSNMLTANYNDTAELYKQILGKFKSIQADSIEVDSGNVSILSDSYQTPLTAFKNVTIQLSNFIVDSNHNYRNIISYFIDRVKVKVENINHTLQDSSKINVEQLEYNSFSKELNIKAFQQFKKNNLRPAIDVKNIQTNGLNTNDFIFFQRLKANRLACDGGVITIYTNGKGSNTANSKKNIIEFSSSTIDEAQVNTIALGNTKVIIITANTDRPPLIMDGVKFNASQLANITSGITISELINTANWKLSVGDCSFHTKNKLYKVRVKQLQADKLNASVSISNISVKSVLSEQDFMKKMRYQTDRYDLDFNNILFKNVDFSNLIYSNQLVAEDVSLEPVIRVFNDRTLPPNPNSKVGKYPHQLLLKMRLPIFFKTIHVRNGYLAYKERAAKSAMIGTVYFSKINGEIKNATNITAKIRNNSQCTLNATANFLGRANLSTSWVLPLNAQNALFSIKGELGSMSASTLNSIAGPLAMAAVKSGTIKKLQFNLTGNDYVADGEVLFLYNDLGLDLLKKTTANAPNTDSLKVKSFVSLFANAIIKKDNPRKDNIYKSSVHQTRELNKSFFNLLWKSIFQGVKETVLGK